MINFVQEIYANSSILIRLIEKEVNMGSVKFVLQAVKSTLLSKDVDVAKWGCRIYSKLVYDLANLNILSDVWEWFISLYGGLYTIHNSFQKHGDEIVEGISSILMQISRYNSTELFTVE